MLTFEEYGTSHSKRLLIAHGLFGSGRNWRAIAKRLSANLHVITVDMRNHAGSFWSDEMDYPAMAADLADVIEAVGSPMLVLGHSMGGKAAMMLALTRPELVERLIVADIAPVAYGHTQTPVIEAMQSVDLSRIQKRADLGDALAQHLDDPALRAFLAQSIEIDGTKAKWRLNLEVLKASMPEIIGWPDISEQYDGPVLFVAGADSDYIDAASRKVIKPLFPSARFAKLKDAGHWLHADQPKAFIETVRAFGQIEKAGG